MTKTKTHTIATFLFRVHSQINDASIHLGIEYQILGKNGEFGNCENKGSLKNIMGKFQRKHVDKNVIRCCPNCPF